MGRMGGSQASGADLVLILPWSVNHLSSRRQFEFQQPGAADPHLRPDQLLSGFKVWIGSPSCHPFARVAPQKLCLAPESYHHRRPRHRTLPSARHGCQGSSPGRYSGGRLESSSAHCCLGSLGQACTLLKSGLTPIILKALCRPWCLSEGFGTDLSQPSARPASSQHQ